MRWNVSLSVAAKAVLVGVSLSSAALLTACVPHKQTGYLEIGNRLDFRQLVSQHGAPFGEIGNVRLVVYADSMDASRMVHRVFADYAPACFDSGTVVFVGDVSGMPSFITRLAAVPLMQSYTYPVWLDYDGTATENLPVLEDQVSLISVEDARMVSIGYAHTDAGIANALQEYCVKMAGKSETTSAP